MLETHLSVKKLREKFPASIPKVSTFRDEVTIEVAKKDLFEVCRFLYTDPELEYQYLTDLCGLDLHPQAPRFAVVYHLYSFKRNDRLRLKARLEENESIASVESIWKVANWFEREAYDLLGIRFENHPDLRRLLLWEGFEGHPLRKDYPVEGPDFDKPFQPEV